MKLRTTLTVLTFVAAITPCCIAQQPASNPIVTGEKMFYSRVIGTVVASAEKMPEENYSFRPTPEVRSFGQLIGHVADAQYGMCSAAAGKPNPNSQIEKTKTTKADLVAAVKDAQAYCTAVFDGMTDAQAATLVKFFGMDMAKITVLSINTAHTDEHYGNIVTYLRLKGIVPPSSEKR